MPIPDYQTLMLPALRALADGAELTPQAVITKLAAEYGLSPEERQRLLPSGRTPLFNSRVHWAVTYLTHAGLIEKPKRAIWRVSEEGRRVLATNPAKIDITFLVRYPAFRDFRQRSTGADRVSGKPVGGVLTGLVPPEETPEEALERIAGGLRQEVADDLLARVRAMPALFFEQLVVRVLVAMGYGGSYAEAAQVVGRSGDEGIDGVIKEDRLGLDAIYVQAKKWADTVGRPEIQKFAGSLEGARARKGVFITTSQFSPDARAYVDKIEKRIVLIDGAMLAGLMMDNNVGVSPDRSYVIPRVDLDFFDEE